MIIAAACKMLINNSEVVLCGVRHSDIYIQLKQMGFKPDDFEELEQGFVTHTNKFLNRHDAYILASKNGQLCARIKHDKDKAREFGKIPELISEDLW